MVRFIVQKKRNNVDLFILNLNYSNLEVGRKRKEADLSFSYAAPWLLAWIIGDHPTVFLAQEGENEYALSPGLKHCPGG